MNHVYLKVLCSILLAVHLIDGFSLADIKSSDLPQFRQVLSFMF